MHFRAVDECGHKALLTMTDGFRESTQSWREVLLDLKRRGLKQDPKLAIVDGVLGFWTALREVFATTREQRCWFHKTMNVLERATKIHASQGKRPSTRHLQADTNRARALKASPSSSTFKVKAGAAWRRVARPVAPQAG